MAVQQQALCSSSQMVTLLTEDKVYYENKQLKKLPVKSQKKGFYGGQVISKNSPQASCLHPQNQLNLVYFSHAPSRPPYKFLLPTKHNDKNSSSQITAELFPKTDVQNGFNTQLKTHQLKPGEVQLLL